MSGFGLDLDNLSYEDAVEASKPAKIPAGTYDFELESTEFREARTGTVGIRFTCKIVNSEDPQWNNRKLWYDGWVTDKGNFLTQALLAFSTPENWDAVTAEVQTDEGFTRIRNGESEILASLNGSVAKGRVIHEKNDDTGEMWPRLRSFVL
jgi:hypothetical protein